VEELHELIWSHIEESIEVHSSESKLLERSLLRLDCCPDLGFDFCHVGKFTETEQSTEQIARRLAMAWVISRETYAGTSRKELSEGLNPRIHTEALRAPLPALAGGLSRSEP
jgi:hypothetical protein